MNKSSVDMYFDGIRNQIERDIKDLINENDLAYQNKQMFYRLYKQWDMKYRETEKKINQLDKELFHIKNPY